MERKFTIEDRRASEDSIESGGGKARSITTTMHSIFPTQKPGPFHYGVPYENFRYSPLFYHGWQKREIADKSALLCGEYDILCLSFDRYPVGWSPKEGRYKEECLTLHRSMRGTLTLTKYNKGKLFGCLEYKENNGTLVPSNGAFSFVEDNTTSVTSNKDDDDDDDKIEFKVREAFCWPNIGKNTHPHGTIQVVERWGALGVEERDHLAMCASKMFYDGGSHRLFSTVPFSQEGREEGQSRARQLLEKYNNIESSWLCTKLLTPSDVARRIRSFLLPPPMLEVREGDLVLETRWDHRDNTTYTIARRKDRNS